VCFSPTTTPDFGGRTRSLETVRTYLRRMFAKLGVNDRTHLAVLAYEAGLLREPR
jgi:DNA-binding NarL/FixJ family response regulator